MTEGVVWANGGIKDTIGASLTGSGGLTKAGTGTLILTGANGYTGLTYVSAGTLQVGDGTYRSNLGLDGDITVAGGAVLSLLHPVTLAEDTTLRLQEFGIVVGRVNLAAGVDQPVPSLFLGETAMPPGTYGSTSSTAAFKSDTWFSGPWCRPGDPGACDGEPPFRRGGLVRLPPLANPKSAPHRAKVAVGFARGRAWSLTRRVLAATNLLRMAATLFPILVLAAGAAAGSSSPSRTRRCRAGRPPRALSSRRSFVDGDGARSSASSAARSGGAISSSNSSAPIASRCASTPIALRFEGAPVFTVYRRAATSSPFNCSAPRKWMKPFAAASTPRRRSRPRKCAWSPPRWSAPSAKPRCSSNRR